MYNEPESSTRLSGSMAHGFALPSRTTHPFPVTLPRSDPLSLPLFPAVGPLPRYLATLEATLVRNSPIVDRFARPVA